MHDWEIQVSIPLGVAGIAHLVPISFASENLGEIPGLFAAAVLMIDYILNAAVGISAGVEALTSAFSSLLPHTLAFCLFILAILTLVNMRGTKDTGIVIHYRAAESDISYTNWQVLNRIKATELYAL
jgi:amino acid transporter